MPRERYIVYSSEGMVCIKDVRFQRRVGVTRSWSLARRLVRTLNEAERIREQIAEEERNAETPIRSAS